ncbi:hypothetical protein JOD82_002207 [Paenibacillus sp. 1182]|uniref:hypothetical protein n=1 Tax=Paenibacillus sp. 1182 TaxID=2806565 RepID=UPI001AE5DC20|nr:hypothetical protein [Paenibacillus sp. 1182]MBP1309187.1 hypothetical protein [Paenibacillus sp. 1182]
MAKMMQIFIFNAYEVSLIDEEGKTILSGDDYHDKIDAKIEGFLECLHYQQIDYELRIIKKIDAEWIYG